jgi:mitogen-activated protein kinase kinase kinase 3
VLSSPGAILMYLSDPATLPEIPERLSADAKDFVRRCCVRNPLQRATCEELVRHPWLRIAVQHEVSGTPLCAEATCAPNGPNAAANTSL